MDEKPHKDSGYFPPLSNRSAWVILTAISLIGAGLIAACVLLWHALSSRTPGT